jgi:peptidoglycan/LPS O-acetylase OafA/YrhL
LAAYRADIDGLRAIAILPVVFFHAGLGILPGGYVGVDIFFVISGYLITLILLEDRESGRISIARFYERRVRRIVPALLVVVASRCAAAWIILPPDQMTAFARTVVSLPIFSSNILFWKQSDYFEATAQSAPLLHTWSLAVEEQFYALFPLLIHAVERFGRSRWGLWFAAIAVISLGLKNLRATHSVADCRERLRIGWRTNWNQIARISDFTFMVGGFFGSVRLTPSGDRSALRPPRQGFQRAAILPPHQQVVVIPSDPAHYLWRAS